MKKVYYSEELKKYFNSEDECVKAEKEYSEKLALEKAEKEKKLEAEKLKKEERAKAAKEVDEALKHADEARDEALQKLNDFIEKYGSYHTSYTTTTKYPVTSLLDTFSTFDKLFDSFFRL